MLSFFKNANAVSRSTSAQTQLFLSSALDKANCADGIGFEDSMNEQRAYWTAEYNNGEKISDTKAGKTVAWINYMTNFNKTFGEFAAGESEDFMVMNRNYERDEENDSLISDLSTYIDPSKYNQIFADTSLSAQNFWVQTAVQIEVRRNISAKQIPNL